MTPDQITALAREYAEECCPIETYEKAELIDPYKEEVFERKVDILATQIEFEQFLEWLLRRYCLVEKDAVRKEYESVKDTPEECNYEELGATWDEWPYLSRFYDEGYKLGQKDTIESLFPEIAKEVE